MRSSGSPTPHLDAHCLEVLADRLTLKESLEDDHGTGAAKHSVLEHALLKRHPELGDRVAKEIVRKAFAEHPDCLAGLERLAEELIEWRGGEIFLRSEIGLRPPRSLLDEDQLVAAMAAKRGQFRGMAYAPIDAELLLASPLPSALDRDLEDLLERPLAETHIHLGGAAPPSTFWLPLVLGLLSMEIAGGMAGEAAAFESGAVRTVREQMDCWIRRLVEATALRWRLAEHLARGSQQHPFRRVRGLSPPSPSLGGYRLGQKPDEVCPEEPRPGDPRILPWLEEMRRRLRAIGMQRVGQLGEESSGGLRIRVDPSSPVPYCDALTRAVAEHLDLEEDAMAPGLGERYLLADALRTVRSANGGPGEGFRDELLRYIRIKHGLLRLLVHFPGIHGLDRFRNRYSRRWQGMRSAFRPGRSRDVWLAASFRFQVRATVLRWLEASTYQQVLSGPRPRDEREGAAQKFLRCGLSSLERRLELRLTPQPGPLHGRLLMAFAQGLRDALDTLRKRSAVPQLQCGIVFHLHKRARQSPPAYRDMLRSVTQWLDDRPAWRPLVLGVDVAGSELDAPPSRFALAYRTVGAWREDCSGRAVLPAELGMTFHVGEDFRDLLTGIRQVDLAVELLGLKAGDRLGHALAVGLEPTLWYRKRGRSFPHIGDHLLDLLWARSQLDDDQGDAELLAALDARIKALEIREAPGAAEKRFRQWMVEQRSTEASHPQEEGELQVTLLGCPGDKLFEVQPDRRWLELLTRLQRRVAQKVDHRGLFIEANPTSNLLIAGLEDFADLPIFHLHPIRPPQEGRATDLPAPEARLSISTDDPEIFRVNLREEYAALFQAAYGKTVDLPRKSADYSRREVLDWLDRLRQDSYKSSFLRTASPAGCVLLRYLRSLTS